MKLCDFVFPWVKSISLLFPFVLFINYISAQSSIDRTYRSSYYEQKVTQFRLLPDTKEENIFPGNSIAHIGKGAGIWQNIHVKNHGISGDYTFGGLARLDEVVSSKPAKVFLLPDQLNDLKNFNFRSPLRLCWRGAGAT